MPLASLEAPLEREVQPSLVVVQRVVQRVVQVVQLQGQVAQVQARVAPLQVVQAGGLLVRQREQRVVDASLEAVVQARD